MANETFSDNFNTLRIGSSLEAVRYFIEEQGVDVNGKGKYGHTPLHWAIVHHSLDVVQYLVFQGADVNAKDNRGTTPLHEIVGRYSLVDDEPNIKILQYLIFEGADVNAKNMNGQTPLDVAFEETRKRILCEAMTGQ